VNIDAVVAKDVQDQIRAAIEIVKDLSYLAPIKSHLSEAIGYEEIRCVVNAVKREQEEVEHNRTARS